MCAARRYAAQVARAVETHAVRRNECLRSGGEPPARLLDRKVEFKKVGRSAEVCRVSGWWKCAASRHRATSARYERGRGAGDKLSAHRKASESLRISNTWSRKTRLAEEQSRRAGELLEIMKPFLQLERPPRQTAEA